MSTRSACQGLFGTFCTPGEEGATSSMSNVNTGLVAGYVCEVRESAVALAAEAGAKPWMKLRGMSDQGKYWSYFMDDVDLYPAAAGSRSGTTLDYCAELVLNMYGGVNTLPLTFNSSERSASLDHQGLSGTAGPEPVCFSHFNGRTPVRSKLFETMTEFNGVRCGKGGGGYKTGPCNTLTSPETSEQRAQQPTEVPK